MNLFVLSRFSEDSYMQPDSQGHIPGQKESHRQTSHRAFQTSRSQYVVKSAKEHPRGHCLPDKFTLGHTACGLPYQGSGGLQRPDRQGESTNKQRERLRSENSIFLPKLQCHIRYVSCFSPKKCYVSGSIPLLLNHKLCF